MPGDSSPREEGEWGMKRKTGELDKSAHQMQLFPVSRPRASGSQVEVGQESEHPREDSRGDWQLAFPPEGLLYSDAHQSESLHNIQENFQRVFWYLVFNYEWPAQNYMTFEKKKLSNREKNMRLWKTQKNKAKES